MAQNEPTMEVKVGDVVKGTIEHVAAYGAFVRLKTGQKAMVHISELSRNYVKKIEDVISEGQEIEAKVIKIDEKGRIDLSIKLMQSALKPTSQQKPHSQHIRNQSVQLSEKLTVDDFEKKLSNFMKFSDEKIADLNNKSRDSRGSKRRGTGHSGKDY